MNTQENTSTPFTRVTIIWIIGTLILTAGLISSYLYLHEKYMGQQLVQLDEDQYKEIDSLIKYYEQLNLENVPPNSVARVKEENEQLAKEKINLYLNLEFPTNSSPFSFANITEKFPVQRLPSILEKVDVPTASYFWLFGRKVYLEIIFWALFGVIASILYRTSEEMFLGEFKEGKIPIHIAKLIYAPISTIVLYFSADLFISDEANNQISHWIIVFSFILGFYSGRMVDLLNRIKDVLLPLGKDKEESTTPPADEEEEVPKAPLAQTLPPVIGPQVPPLSNEGNKPSEQLIDTH